MRRARAAGYLALYFYGATMFGLPPVGAFALMADIAAVAERVAKRGEEAET